MNNKQYKIDFLKSELFMLSWNAATARSSTYNSDFSNKLELEKKKKEIKNYVKSLIEDMIEIYCDDNLNIKKEKKHILNIKNISKSVSEKYHKYLFKGRCRIGASQKVLNLYLKYLWCIKEIEEPPHCPIDFIILTKFKEEVKDFSNRKEYFNSFDTSWTKLDSIEKYEDIISKAKIAIKDKSLSKWELEKFSRHEYNKSN